MGPATAVLAQELRASGGADEGLQADIRTTAVVEFFTSQGCSSCPPADHLAALLAAERPDLLILSYAVDYWDFLGWPDTLARPENGQRQRNYARRRGDKAVYTPQLVVNGGPHLVGHDRAHLESLVGGIDAPNNQTLLSVQVDLSSTAKTVQIGVYPARKEPLIADQASGNQAEMSTIWALLISSHVDVSVGAGENTGRLVRYTNVVREMLPVGVFEGQPRRLALPLQDLVGAEEDVDRIAILVQEQLDGAPGRILGGAILAAPALSARR